MPVYVIQHPLHPGMVVLKRRLHRPPPWRLQLVADGHNALDRSCGFVTGRRTSPRTVWINGERGRLQTGGFHIVPNSDSSRDEVGCVDGRHRVCADSMSLNAVATPASRAHVTRWRSLSWRGSSTTTP
jgi:hypothetical protein